MRSLSLTHPAILSVVVVGDNLLECLNLIRYSNPSGTSHYVLLTAEVVSLIMKQQRRLLPREGRKRTATDILRAGGQVGRSVAGTVIRPGLNAEHWWQAVDWCAD